MVCVVFGSRLLLVCDAFSVQRPKARRMIASLERISTRLGAFVCWWHRGCDLRRPSGIGETAQRVRVRAVEPTEAAALSGAPVATRRIEGSRLASFPPLWRPELVDLAEQVRSEEAQEVARRLAAVKGVFAGTSTRANVIAALHGAETLPTESRS